MGTFASSANFGDLLGAGVFAAVALGAGGSWYVVIFITSIVMVITALMFAAFGAEKPVGDYKEIINFDEVAEKESLAPREHDVESGMSQKDGISFFQAWTIPGVALYAGVYACVKCVNYGMMMWLPYYVKEGLGKPTFD